ncbi:hypothetical protein [Altererythrobacter sp. Root672]|uniref:hypothetical protein n=1 Tax=Altererythrobacter sp. Root672 TaxID=1736584 RepID=UPI0006F41EB7|nr:hypothetical protein [Altererythrobacter sp. Root672]KRA83909.1 hypothetical protein ASD76_07845 [Altererythrobacter sp. Root672]
MDLMRIVRSLEEFLYEVMTWLVFYPRTMWRAVRHPIEMLHYANRELQDQPDRQFADLLSPPLFLMITILLSHMIEVSSHQTLPTGGTSFGRQVAASEWNLLVLRSMLFAVYPLMFAVSRIRREGLPLNRETLRPPFFAQCYIAAPAAFAIGISSILTRSPNLESQAAGILIFFGAVIWYISIEVTWLRSRMKIGRAAAIWAVFRTWLAASLINALVTVVVLGM